MSRRRRAANGRSTVSLGKDGRWHGRVSFGTDPVTGKRIRPGVAARTEAEAWAKVRVLEDERAAGDRASRRRAGSLEQFAQTWLTRTGLEAKERTVRGYESHLRLYVLPTLGRRKIAGLKPEDVEAVYTAMRKRQTQHEKPMSASTVLSVRRTLNALFNDAVARGAMPANPVTIARKPAAPRTAIQPFSTQEVHAILEAAAAMPDCARFTVAMALGLRQGEALGLTFADFDLEQASLTVRRSVARRKWRHGCNDAVVCAKDRCRTELCPQSCRRHTRACPPPCEAGCTRHASTCPDRVGGGLHATTTKSHAADRTIGLPPQMVDMLRAHTIVSKRAALTAGRPWTPQIPLFPGPSGGWRDPRRDWAD